MTRSPIRVAGRALLWLVVVMGVVGGAVGTILLTVPRLGDPSSTWALLFTALTPAGLAAAMVLLVAATIAALVTQGWLRALGWVLAVLGAVGVAVHLVWLAPLYLGTAPSAAPGRPLVILAQNIEGGDADALAREVEAGGVDVLVLSDISGHQSRAIEATTISRALPHVFFTGGGPTVYSRYPMTEEVVKPSPTSDEAGVARGPLRSVRIETPTLGAVRLVALHPTPPYQPDLWTQDFHRIENYLTQTATARPVPTILAGDFNATLDHAPVRRIGALGYTDGVVQTSGGFRPTWPAPGSVRKFRVAVPPLVQIDHVMVSDRLVVTATSNVEVPGADHLGVIASVQRAAR